MSISVISLRRYPVKGMGGESLATVSLDARGLEGDRWFAVADDDGHLASAKNTRRFRRRDAVLTYSAVSQDAGVVVTRDAQAWAVGSPALDADLSSACGVAVRVAPETAVPHQDAGAVSIVGSATLAWCADRWGIDADPRRLRVNLVVATAEPFVEESWVGQELTVGGTRLKIASRVERCRTIDVAQDGSTASGRWLKPLAAERDMRVAIYADVVTPGSIAVGDPVAVVAG